MQLETWSGTEDAIIFMLPLLRLPIAGGGIWSLIFAGFDVGLRDGSTSEMVLPEPRVTMPDHAITVSDPVRTVLGEFDDSDALIAHGERGCTKLRKTRSMRWVISGLCCNSRAHNLIDLGRAKGSKVWLSRANEVRVRAEVGAVDKHSEGAQERYSREGVDERDGSTG